MGYWQNLWVAIKANQPRKMRAGSTSWIAGTGRPFIPPASQFDYLREAGDLQRNSVFSVCHGWLARQFLQPDWCVGYETARDEWKEQKHHALRKLLENIQKRPDQRLKTTSRDNYGGAIGDYCAHGNAYLCILPNASGIPVALTWFPAKQMQLETNEDGIARYRRYCPSGATEFYEPEQIVHIKYLPDPDEPLIGIGPVQNQVRNIAALNAGERTNGALLRNGTMGKLLTPKISVEAISKGEPVDEAALKETSQKIRKRTSGDHLGSLVETTMPVELLDLGASPEDLAINEMLDRPESMICAAMGLNPMALNLTSSRDTRTYSNYQESIKSAWDNGVVPLRDAFADAFTSQLAVYWDESGELRVWSDYDDVPAMRDDSEKRASVSNLLFTSTLYTRNDALTAGGFKPIDGPDGDKYFGDPSEEQAAQMEAEAEQQALNAEDEAAQEEGNKLLDHELELDRMKFAAKLKPATNGVKK